MKNFYFFVLLFTGFILTKPASTQIDYKGFPQWSWHKQDSTEYYLYTPSEENPNGLYPIVLFLHGCCGENYHATLRNTVDPPVRMWHNFGANTQSVPTYIISPATSRGWKQHIQNLKKVMDDLIQNHHGDPARIYITGFSMGGSGTWEFLQQYPNYFAAAIPMGMDFQGEAYKIKNIPIWANRGETDFYAKNLHKDVGEIRKLNGDYVDSNQNWVTGVNPRFTSFKDYGHGVQWVAASTQDLKGWAYSKINDGNIYPVVFFKSPEYKQKVMKGDAVFLQIIASDPDGSISKIVIRVNGRPHSTLTRQPYLASFAAPEGDAIIEATAFDNKGKSSTATTIVSVDIKTKFITQELPFARAGAFYEKALIAKGNGIISFSIDDKSLLPPGLNLNNDGILNGLPQTNGIYKINIIATDEDGDVASKTYRLSVEQKKNDEIIVTNCVNDSGIVFPVSKMHFGVLTHFNKDDNEITVSNCNGYEGMTFIPGNSADINRTSKNYLSFNVDEDARVYIAYEKKDHLFTSTIPPWIKEWNIEPSGQIVAQYFYYNLYYKDFPKGKITLPGADEKNNNGNNNYFVLVRKISSPYQFIPEINTTKLSEAKLFQPYKEMLTALHGEGGINWRLTKGKLPVGLHLLPNGTLNGTPEIKGSFTFIITVNDRKENMASKELTLVVK